MHDPMVSTTALRRVIEALPRSIVLTDALGVILLWNKQAELLFGWTEAEVVGRSVTEVLVPASDDAPPSFADVAEPGDETWPVERTVLKRDGTSVRVRALTRVLLDDEGAIEFIVAASEDLSQLRLLERSAREATRLERIQRERLELVSLVNDALVASTGLRDLMTKVAAVVVPRLGDWCALHVFESPESAEPIVEVAHVDPSMLQYARDLLARFPYDPDAATGVAHVVRTGEPEFYPEITSDLVRDLAATPEAQRIVEELALRSAIAVPLGKDGQVMGVLQLVMTADHRRYTSEDLELAQVVAARIADTLDNRRLRDAQARTAAVDARLADLGWQLAAAAEVDQVLAVIAKDATGVMGADAVQVGLVLDAEHVHLVPTGAPLTPENIARFETYDVAGPSALARAVRSGERQFSEQGGDPIAPAASALIASPLFDAEHHVIGVLVFTWHGEQRFDDFDRTAIATLSRLCGQALRRAQTSGYTNQLGELAAAMASARTTGDVAKLLREHSGRALGASIANLRLLDPPSGTLRGVIESDLPPELRQRYEVVHLTDGLPLTDAVAEDRPVWVPNRSEYASRYPHVVEAAIAAGVGATAAIPLHTSDGEVIGAVALAWGAAMSFDGPMRTRLATLGDLAAQTLERVSLYEAEHALILTMQHQLLTRLPDDPELELAGFYEPAAVAVGMGGDWYDAVHLRDGSLVAIIGDIVGHGVGAVASMSKLQHLVAGLIRTGTPLDEVFERVNEIAQGADPIYATSLLLHIDVAEERLGVLSAGHPWPMLRTPDGVVHVLTGGRQAMIGATMRATALDYVDLPPGSTVLAYTDGLIERRNEDLEVSIERLRHHLGRIDSRATVHQILDGLVTAVTADHDHTNTTDDIAALLARTHA